MGEMVSYLEIVRRTCNVGGERIDVGGVGGVMTRPEWRRRGFASEGLRRAAGFLRDELRVDSACWCATRARSPSTAGRAGMPSTRPLPSTSPAAGPAS